MSIIGVHRHRAAATYDIVDRLHGRHAVGVPAERIGTTVAGWLAELDAESPLADQLARAARRGDWAAAHAIGDLLSVDVMVA